MSWKKESDMAEFFNFYDFTNSSVADEKKIDNTPDEDITKNIIRLMDVIDDLRKDWGKKCEEKYWGKAGLNITSGYRCPKLNKEVGGSKTSSHLTGNAADIVPTNGRVKDLISFTYSWFKDKGLKWDQIIDEYDGKWMHLGLYNNDGLQRCQHFNID